MTRRDRPGRYNRKRATRKNQAFYNVSVRDIVLQRNKLRAGITRAITGAEFVLSVKEASNVTLTIHDKQRRLLEHDVLTRKVRFTIDDREFVSVSRSKSQDDFTVIGEVRAINKLRQYDEYIARRRGRVTRAQFLKELCDEARVPFFCPELNIRQPIERASDQDSKDKKERERRGGIGGSIKDLKIVAGDGSKSSATPAQVEIIERCLDVAESRNVLPRAALALVEALMIESLARNDTTPDEYGSIGVLQARVGYSNGIHGTITQEQALDPEYMAACFLEDSPNGGFASKGGAQYLARTHPDWSAGQIAQQVEMSAFPERYDKAREEAEKFIEAYGGGSGLSYEAKKPYIFSRGTKDGEREDSWACMRRLADEVRWYLFEYDGTIYFMSGDYLLRAKVFMTLSERDEGVDWINWTNDEGTQIDSATIELNSPKRWSVPQGSIIELDEQGSMIDGRWVVVSISGSLLDLRRTIEVERPVKRAPEPANETETRTREGSTDISGTIRERIVEVAELSRESYNRNPDAWFYSQRGTVTNQDPTRPPKSGSRSDCSLWVLDVYKKAGAPSPAGSSWTGFTGSMQATGHSVSLDNLKPGDLVLYGSGDAFHVELYVGPGDRTIGHGSPPVDYGTVNMIGGARGWTYDFLDEEE